MLITRKNLLLGLLLCATFGLSLIFGSTPANIRVPEPQVRNESPFTPTFISQQSTKPLRAKSWQWHESIDLHRRHAEQQALYQLNVCIRLLNQKIIFFSTQAIVVRLENFIFKPRFAIDKPH